MPKHLRTLAIVIVALAPLLAVMAWRVVLHPRPFWAHSFDPELIYFYDGMRLLDGHAPANVDNPGTPVQLASAAALWISGRSPLDVERFRIVVYVISLVLAFIGAWLLVAIVFADASPLLTIAAIWTWFLTPSALTWSTIWSPEIVYFFDVALLLAAIRKRKPLLAGLGLGLAIATKFVFLAWIGPLVIAVFLMKRSWRDASIALGGVVAGFMIATLPAATRYDAMFAWLAKLATHGGQYGTGAAAAPNFAHALAHYAQLAVHAKGALLWCAAIAIAAFVAKKRNTPEVAFGIAAVIASIAITARDPQYHYMLPAGLAAIAILASLELPQPANGALFVMALVLTARAVLVDIRSEDGRTNDLIATRASIDEATERIAGKHAFIVYGWRAPEPSFALHAMTADARNHAVINAAYPREGYVDFAGEVHGAYDLMIIDETMTPPRVFANARDLEHVGRFTLFTPVR